MWYKNIAGRFFGLVTKHACEGRTDMNYDSQDRASIARAVNIDKSLYFGNGLTGRHEIWHGDIHCPSEHYQQLGLIFRILITKTADCHYFKY